MIKGLKEFAFSKMTIALLIFGLIYPIIMIGIYIPSYAHAGNSINNLTIAIVNEDADYGAVIAENLAGSLTMKTKTNLSLDEAMNQLELKKLELVIQIPSDFTALLLSAETPQINYYTNGTTATMARSIISSISSSIQNGLDEQLGGTAGVISSSTVINNTGSSLLNQIGPMFLTIASYTCGLMLAMILLNMINEKRKKLGRFRTFLYAEILGVFVALFAPLGGILIYSIFSTASFFTMLRIWLLLGCLTFASLQINLCFNWLFKNFGSLFSMAAMLCQLMASGALFSRALMLAPFRWLSYITPFYYVFEGISTIMFGGVNLVADVLILLSIDAILVGCALLVYTLKASKTKKADAGAKLTSETKIETAPEAVISMSQGENILLS